ncbi:APC family permease [Sphingomonas sp.]|uniref:APC family permease n=1 Tax=Sphingomonas sp. TaxID=28214 RepID=UPI002DD63AFA|nr:APC family permease [Sphingomonas sp.]
MSASPGSVSGSYERLRGNVGYAQYFALGFGCIIGSGWVVIAGDWLAAAGPGGAILGFLLGGAVMAIVGACYAELTSRVPEAGSEFAYANRVFGIVPAFAVGWFLLLYFLGVTIFEGLAIAWILEIAFPVLRTATLYELFGHPISGGALVIGVVGAVLLAVTNLAGVQAAARLQGTLTYGFLAVAIVLLAMLLFHGTPENARPAFASASGQPWLHGTLWIFATSAFLLNGFQAIPQVVEERSSRVSLRAVAFLIVLSIIAGVAFYCVVIWANAVSLPWRQLAGTEMATATSVGTLPHGDRLTTILLLAAAVSLFKTWNGMVIMAARVMVAMARAGALPARFAAVDRRFGSPANAILLIAIINVAGLFLGRGAIIPIINMCSMTLTLTFVMCCVAVLVLRRREGATAGFQVPGGVVTIVIGGVAAATMSVVAFLSPLFGAEAFPLEYTLLILWSLAGAAFWAGHRRIARGGYPTAA